MRLFTLCKAQFDKLVALLQSILDAIVAQGSDTDDTDDDVTSPFQTLPICIGGTDSGTIEITRTFDELGNELSRSDAFFDAAGDPIDEPGAWTLGYCRISAGQILHGEPVCGSIGEGEDATNGFAVPTAVYNPNTGTLTAGPYLDPNTMLPLGGTFTPGDPCDCECGCPDSEFSGCLFRVRGFDYQDFATWTPGDPMTWTVDGVPVSIDVATLPAGATVKSAWYQPLWDALPAGWSVSVVSDAPATSNQKPVFQFDYTGAGPASVDIVRTSGTSGDTISLAVAADGSYVAGWNDSDGNPINSNESIQTCDGTPSEGDVSGQLPSAE